MNEQELFAHAKTQIHHGLSTSTGITYIVNLTESGVLYATKDEALYFSEVVTEQSLHGLYTALMAQIIEENDDWPLCDFENEPIEPFSEEELQQWLAAPKFEVN